MSHSGGRVSLTYKEIQIKLVCLICLSAFWARLELRVRQIFFLHILSGTQLLISSNRLLVCHPRRASLPSPCCEGPFRPPAAADGLRWGPPAAFTGHRMPSDSHPFVSVFAFTVIPGHVFPRSSPVSLIPSGHLSSPPLGPPPGQICCRCYILAFLDHVVFEPVGWLIWSQIFYKHNTRPQEIWVSHNSI